MTNIKMETCRSEPGAEENSLPQHPISDTVSGLKSHVNSSGSGFTLLELLVSVTIFAIILGALYSTFSLSKRAMDGLDESVLRLHECRTALDVVRREGDSLLYKPGDRNSIFKIEDRDIYGKPASRFVFNTYCPLHPGLSTVSYYVGERGEKLTLNKTISPAYQYSAKADQAAPSDQEGDTELLGDIEAFTVEAKSNDIWTRTWDASSLNRVPDELRVTITVSLKGRKISLHEILKPKVGHYL